jgi:chaperonin cofactor prefoldin
VFGLFKKKSPADKLEKKYQKLLEEAHRLSTVNRADSDAKMAEANEVLKEIEQLNAD